MKLVLFDSDVLLDVLAQRQPLVSPFALKLHKPHLDRLNVR